MRVTKKVKQMREVEVTVENYNLCDKCNERIETEDCWDAFKCEFIHKTGAIYPEVGSGERQKAELCQKCAIELVSLLRENGYRVIDSEWDC